MEDGVFVCAWSALAEGYSGWVKNRPALRVTAPSLETLAEVLRRAIFDRAHCMHPVLEFDPPLPVTGAFQQFGVDDIVEISGGNDGFSVLEFPPGIHERPFKSKIYWDTYFTARSCHSCHTPTGIRNELPLHVKGFSGDSDGGFCGMGSGFRYVYSEAFLGLFQPHELVNLEFRPIVRDARARKKYFELIGPSGPPFVAVKQIAASTSQCCECGRKKVSYFENDDQPFPDFTQRSNHPNPIATIFTIGKLPYVKLCMRRDRWQSIVGKKNARGITSRRTGIVEDAFVDPDPKCEHFIPQVPP